MISILSVALGGALGAVLRFLISKIAILNSHDIPWMTFTANMVGALIIGFIAGAVFRHVQFKPATLSFLKTGFCGGLTTFSTFSLESFELIQHGKYLAAGCYLGFSVILCLFGVFVGRAVAIKCFE